MDTVEAGRVVPCHWAHARPGPRGHLLCGSRAGRDAAAPWTRARLALRVPEREELAHGLARGKSLRQMGHRLGRAPSTVSREVRRHGGRTRYRAAAADTRAWARARRPKPCRLAGSVALRTLVATTPAQHWSPQQIAGWLRQTFPADPELHVSHETIDPESVRAESGGAQTGGHCCVDRLHPPRPMDGLLWRRARVIPSHRTRRRRTNPTLNAGCTRGACSLVRYPGSPIRRVPGWGFHARAIGRLVRRDQLVDIALRESPEVAGGPLEAIPVDGRPLVQPTQRPDGRHDR